MKTYPVLKSIVQFFIFILSTSIYSQNCLPAGIDLSSQQQIDDFADDYNGCSVIEGDVMIFGGSGDITNLNGLLGLTKIEGNLDVLLNTNLLTLDGLDNLTEVDGFVKLSYSQNLNSISGLKNLTTVGGDFSIVNTNISDLAGLEKLETVTGDLEIFNNSSLTSLSGIESLTSVGGNFYLEQSSLLMDIEGLKELTTVGGDFEIEQIGVSDFTGLEKLTSVGGDLRIGYNDALQNCTGLDNLSTLGGHLFFLGNPALTGFEGLGSLTSIGGILTISNNDELTDLNGLNNLSTIDNYLNVAYNDELTSLNGLNGLTSIGGNLNIAQNPNLTDISAIAMIDPASIASNTNATLDIVIYENDLLSECENLAICQALNSGKTSNISNNATGCNTAEEVEFECASSILPVKWLEPLRAKKVEKGNHLTFSTSQEVNNEMFILERSRDGIQYAGTQNIKGQGNTSKETHYSIFDETPLNGMNYYRLKQVDYDARFTYSNVVVIDNSKTISQLQIYPNPASTKLNIKNSNEEIDIQILNARGELVKSQKLAKGLNNINLENFPKGLYIVKSQNGIAHKVIVE